MIVTIVTFTLPEPSTLAQMTEVFKGTAPKYRSVPGLLRKNYWLSEDGRTAGGIYVWRRRSDADAMYNDEWRAFVTAKYGTPPDVRWLDSPVMVDNDAGRVVVDAA